MSHVPVTFALLAWKHPSAHSVFVVNVESRMAPCISLSLSRVSPCSPPYASLRRIWGFPLPRAFEKRVPRPNCFQDLGSPSIHVLPQHCLPFGKLLVLPALAHVRQVAALPFVELTRTDFRLGCCVP